MLQVKWIHHAEECLGFCFPLCLDPTYASYPRMNAINHIRREIESSIADSNKEIIAVYDEEQICAVIAYFWEDSEKYIQTTLFLVTHNQFDVVKLAMEYVFDAREDYRLLIGIPSENPLSKTLEYFGRKIEDSYHMILDNLPLLPTNSLYIEEVTKTNFDDYDEFHNRFAKQYELYWDSKNLRNKLSSFGVFTYQQDSKVLGSIFYKKGDTIQEIYGLFMVCWNDDIGRNLLTAVLNQIKQESLKVHVLYFIDKDSEKELLLAKDHGFFIQENYLCYEVTNQIGEKRWI